MEQKIAVLIPCYNEEKTIKKVALSFQKELPNAQIYIYNNNSTDKTLKIANSIPNVIVRNEYKQGKGNVVRKMFQEIDADIYVMVDGDNTYPTKAVHKLIEPIINKEADMVVGDRLSNGTYKYENKRKFHFLGNQLVKNIINILFKSKLNDIMSGYRVFNKKLVKSVPILSEGFELETELTLSCLDKRYIIKEIPINYKDRPKGSVSKLNTFKDGFKVLKTIFKIYKNYKPFRFFCLLSLFFLILGLTVGIPVIIEFIKTSYITKIPSSILATGLILMSCISFQSGLILDTIVKNNKENYELSILNKKD